MINVDAVLKHRENDGIKILVNMISSPASVSSLNLTSNVSVEFLVLSYAIHEQDDFA